MEMCLDMIGVKTTCYKSKTSVDSFCGFSPLAQTYLLHLSLLPVRGRVVSRVPAAWAAWYPLQTGRRHLWSARQCQESCLGRRIWRAPSTDRHALLWNIIARLKTDWAPWTELMTGAGDTKQVREKIRLKSGAMKTYLKRTSKGFEEVYVFINLSIGQMEILEDEKSADDQTHSDSVFGSPSSGSWADLICTKCWTERSQTDDWDFRHSSQAASMLTKSSGKQITCLFG